MKDYEKKVEVPFAITTKEKLFEAMLLQNTYTDIVELVLKFLKSQKGTPADLVELF